MMLERMASGNGPTKAKFSARLMIKNLKPLHLRSAPAPGMRIICLIALISAAWRP
jgi:hypothetical protein